MKAPKKWRETINPFLIEFNNFKIIKVLGYPPAKNDVFYVKGIYNNKNVYAYIKHARNDTVNFIKEIELLKNDKLPCKVKLLDYDKEGKFIVTQAKRGRILSKVLKENSELSSLDFLKKHGEMLARIHKLDIKCSPVSERKFFYDVSEEYAKRYGLNEFREFLMKRKPNDINKCFCHGDMHYGNVLWNKGKVAAILDYELSGTGNKEFDIAWAIIKRPTQNFGGSKQETDAFLSGYRLLNDYVDESVRYYMALIYMHFYEIGKENKEYIKYVYNWLKEYCKE